MRDLARVGIWSRELRFGEAADMRAGAAELEDMGFGTLWVPGGFDGPGDIGGPGGDSSPDESSHDLDDDDFDQDYD